jgi:inosine-uridine nucleoside N-ribohydrolase
MSARPLIIDCDTGRDDALSIWIALASGYDLAAVVASYGNTTLDNVCENCARVLALAGRADIPVWRGESRPSAAHCGVAGVILPKQLASGNGLCDLELPVSPQSALPMDAAKRAAALRRIAGEKGGVDYIILGPATNCAATLAALADEAPQVIARVTMMGGKTGALWDEMPGADFNLACDPFAVKAVLEETARHDIPLRFVPMNVTWPIMLDLPQLESLTARGAVGKTAKELMIAHARHFAPEPFFRFHDPCVIMALSHEACFRRTNMRIIDKDGVADFGCLIVDAQGVPVALFEADEALRMQMLGRILDLLTLDRAC